MNKYDTIHEELSQRVNEVTGYWTKQYNYIRDDMRFRTGNQWTNEGLKSRKNKPTLTLNFTEPVINRVVNPIRKHPFGVNVKNKDNRITKLYQGLVRDIEYESVASEAYECALDNGAGVGMGWVKIATEFADDRTLNQVPRIKPVPDPTTVWPDPHFQDIAGRDMEYLIESGQVSKRWANKKYDIENDPGHQMIFSEIMNTHWNIPEDSYPELIYYCKKYRTEVLTVLKDGTSFIGESDIPPSEDMIAGTRELQTPYIKIYHFIGGKLIEETEMQTQYIPFVPCLGDRVYDSDSWKGWGGIVRKVKDSQSMINYYASAEAQLVQSAPVSPWIIEEGQIEGYEDIWASANTDLHDHLPYKASNLGNSIVPPPQRVDNTAQTGHLMQSRMAAVEDLQRASGVFDSSIGKDDAPGQSGRAILLKQNTAEVSNYHYVDNLTKTISQVGRILLDLINSLYDTERELTVRGETGETTVVNGNVTDYGAHGDTFDTEVEAGPMVQYEKEMANATLLEIGRLIPDKFGNFADIIVDNVQSPGTEEAVERLRKMLPPELLPAEEGKMDPQAEAALQAANQTIEQLKQVNAEYEAIMQNLQTQIIDNESDRKAKIEAEKIKADTDMAIAELDNATKIQLEQIKAGSKAESDNKKIIADARARMDEQVNQMTEDAEAGISETLNISPENAMDEVQQVGGPVGGSLDEDIDEGPVEDLGELLKQ